MPHDPSIPTAPSYTPPMEQRKADYPHPNGIPTLENWKSQKPLVSITKKLLKLPKMNARAKLPSGKPGKKKQVKFY